jgi:protein-S-isoprenylcysteine O-methyltransferase Ste14
VTTVPAAGNIALGLAFWIPHEIWGSGTQLLLNISGMALAGWATLAFQQAVWSRMSARRARRLKRRRKGSREPEGA